MDSFESFREATHVEEAEELDSLVAQVTSGGPEQAAAVYPRFRKIVSTLYTSLTANIPSSGHFPSDDHQFYQSAL